MMNAAIIDIQCVVAGLTLRGQLGRDGASQIGERIVLAAGAAGTVSDEGFSGGVENLPAGHGLQAADWVDIHWTDDDGSHKCAREAIVATADADSITFEVHEPVGDLPIPDVGGAVVVSKQQTITAAFDGDDAQLVAVRATERAMADFRTASASLAAVKLAGGEGWCWAADSGIANPLTGNPVASVRTSNGSTTPAVLTLGVLHSPP